MVALGTNFIPASASVHGVNVPYGMAKRIVAAMPIGGAHFVRDEHMVTFRSAAKRCGVRVSGTAVHHRGVWMHKITRVG